MKHMKDLYTNEDLSERFDSQFALVSYAINVARSMILSGRDPQVFTDVQNPVYNVLEEILNHREVMAQEEQEESELS